MIGEYEIPKGSKLYFGDRARKKRTLENRAANMLSDAGFEEIVTPIFSYHQGDLRDRSVIRFGDESNHAVALRADSALEVVRLILKRLGRSTAQRKWFYIQPVLHYPTRETHQIGAESIDDKSLPEMIALAAELLKAFEAEATLQVGSIAVCRQVAELLDEPIEALMGHQLHHLLHAKEPWVAPLARLSDPADLESVIAQVPESLREPLARLGEHARAARWPKVALSPLYYGQMSYYDDLYFRFIRGNDLLAMGGDYESGEGRASGFALYTDALLN
jgi:ATP phosphoribosyltransferase regulatory subunit HisZ